MLDEFARNGVGYGNESIHIACLVSSKQQLQELRQELNASELFASLHLGRVRLGRTN